MKHTFAGDTQQIYGQDHYVQWNELQVWLGIPFYEVAVLGHYAVSPGMIYKQRDDGLMVADRRATRLIRRAAFITQFKGAIPGNAAVMNDGDDVIF